MTLDELIRLSLNTAAAQTAMTEKQESDLLKRILTEYSGNSGKTEKRRK